MKELIATRAILGIDTLWGGDVMCPSGTGPLHRRLVVLRRAAAAGLHPSGGRRVRAERAASPRKQPDRAAIDAYLAAVDVRGAIARSLERKQLGGLRGAYLDGLAICFEVMWDLADGDARQGRAGPVRALRAGLDRRAAHALRPRGRSASASRSCWPAPATPSTSRRELLAAVDAWRREPAGRRMASVRALGDAVHRRARRAHASATSCRYLPAELHAVPRANIDFLPIKDAWFSGSMNYLGRARRPDGTPEYEATYEINASLEISVPEFEQLVSHEVVPGHVTTFAYLQNLYVRGAGRLRGDRADHEHARRHALRGDRQQRHPAWRTA